MKKQFLIIATVCAAVCSFSACENTDSSDLNVLNEMLNANYSQIELTVTDTFDEDTSLKSDYVIKYSDSEIEVEYSVEEFAEISLDSITSNPINTLTGVAVIKNGAISFEGDEVDITADIATLGLNFKKEYFSNAKLASMYFTADVKDASGFLGSQLTCTDMSVKATFTEVFKDIRITYTSESGSEVAYKYTFTK